MDSSQRVLVAGVSAGIAGVLTFLLIHHVWIVPVWFILSVGVPIGVLGGLAVGWAYKRLIAESGALWWHIPAMIIFIALMFLPTVIIGQFRPVLLEISFTDFIPRVSLGHVLWHVLIELLVPASTIGALVGWLLTRDRVTAAACALGCLAIAIGPGHNVPLFVGADIPSIPSILYVKAAVLLFGPVSVSTIILVIGSMGRSPDAVAII